MINTTLEFIHDVLTCYQQPKRYGTILQYRPKPNKPLLSTILLGFPDLTRIPTLLPPTLIADMPVLVVNHRAVSTFFESQGPTWDHEVHYEEKIGISNISIRGRDCLNEASSFGDSILGKDGRKCGLTCAHCLHMCKISESVVCPSAADIASHIHNIIPYTKDGPESRPTIKPSKARQEELKHLRCTFEQVSDDNEVELKN